MSGGGGEQEHRDAVSSLAPYFAYLSRKEFLCDDLEFSGK